MRTCSFVACAEVDACSLPGGCVAQRFGPAPTRTGDALKRGARALNGVLPRASRDPRFIKRRRKALR